MEDNLTEEEQGKCYDLFDDIQADATAGTNTSNKDEARKRLQSILSSVSELQRILQ